MLVAGIIVVAYALLINRYWHFTVDSALYLTLARSLVQGKGYSFNGVPHCHVPGGWAYTLSLLLRVSPAFLWLNVVQALIMLAALAVLYLALRQITGPPDALVVVLLTAFSIWVYEYAMALMSEAPFFLLSNLAVLFLLKATRAPSRRARAVFTIGLCAAAAVAFVFRLVACFWLAPFAAALLLENRAQRRLPGRLASAVSICIALIACYLVYRHWNASGMVSPEGAAVPTAGGQPGPAAAATEAGASGYAMPPLTLGWLTFSLKGLLFWPPWVLWPPTGLAQRMTIKHIAWWLTWIPNLVVALGCYRASRRGQTLVAASILFFVPFLLWSTGGKPTTGRYAIAVVPFVMMLFLLGLRQLGELLRDRVRLPLRPGVLVGLGAVSILVPSLVLFCIDVWMQRSLDYYAAFRGGGYAGMMGSIRWLRAHDVPAPVASRDHATLRAVACLANLPVARMGDDVAPVAPGFEEAARRFAAETGVRYMLTMDKYRIRRWPIWHIPRERLGGRPLHDDFWQIWHYDAGTDELRRIPAAPEYRWPTELPMGRRRTP